MTKKRRRPPARDEVTGELFPDLPLPPAASEMLELRALKRPVWTEQKAKLIARYLKLFAYVTKHGTYIDGFAGRQSAETDFGWAAELVLANEPRWFRRFYLFDNDPKQISALEDLRRCQPLRRKGEPKREIEILSGDFNVNVNQILATRKLDPATFCLLDQRTFECKWSTVTALAAHRPEGAKIELFYFLPIGWIDRAIHATTKGEHEIDTWWGNKDWRKLVDLQGHEKARAFQQKFEQLGYRYVWPFPIWDRHQGSRVMFYMILATDHPEAPKLMWRAYNSGVHDEAGWDQLTLALDHKNPGFKATL